MELQGKRVLVVGMARSGHAAVDLLLEKGALPRATDSKPAAEIGSLNVPFVPQGPGAFADVDLIVVSPGVPADLDLLEDARRRGVKVIGEVELASWFLAGPIIGITGANGKTTTTALIGHILRECGIPVQVGGNIGCPPTAMVKESRSDRWNVLELSSFQLETIETFRVQIGLALNVTPDHLDRHHTFEAYAAAKGRLFETQQPCDAAVLNADDPVCVGYAANFRSRPIWFSMNQPVTPGLWVERGQVLFDGLELMPVAEIPLRGRHNVENVMAAAAAARLAGADPVGIRAAVRTFPGVEHRIEFVREIGGVQYYNDSKATNVDATLKAIDAFEGGLWIILGGKDKGSDYTPLRAPLAQKARAALLIGAAAEKIASQIAGGPPLIPCGTLDVAVRRGFELARPGDTVLLAPACASFDQFQNYEHRGKMFKSYVHELEKSPECTG
jgi:UDP-N-acetylmuramoylalanine--D-glutamate ligase